jgi:hypothetical protein
MMRVVLTIGAALLATACSEPSETVPPLENAIDATPASNVITGATPTATARTERLSEMPEALRGRWGLVAADCEPGRADAKGLMTIEPKMLRFYESRAEVTAIEHRSPDVYRVHLSFSGEGQQWTETDIFTLAGDGLSRRSRGTRDNLLYTRCPA